MKKEFMISECFMLSIMGAFQRASIYKESITEIEKADFKIMLKGYLDNLIEEYKKHTSEEVHLFNIESLSTFTTNFSHILKNDKLNFGVSQKLLNLYLKYLWCLDISPAPPHFPVDSIIQKKMKLRVIPWTKMIDQTEYMKVINHAKTQLEQYNCQSLPELELKLFKRK